MAVQDLHPFETGLDRNTANYVPLSPVSFLTRAASAFGNKVAVIDGERHFTYRQLLDRCVRLASGLSKLGIGRLDTVAIIASNIPEMRRPSRPSPRKCVTAGCLYVRNSAWDRVIDTDLKVRR